MIRMIRMFRMARIKKNRFNQALLLRYPLALTNNRGGGSDDKK